MDPITNTKNLRFFSCLVELTYDICKDEDDDMVVELSLTFKGKLLKIYFIELDELIDEFLKYVPNIPDQLDFAYSLYFSSYVTTRIHEEKLLKFISILEKELEKNRLEDLRALETDFKNFIQQQN